MRHADIAIVGGGLAGSTAAAMLGRAGRNVVLIDPHAVYPADFRCEKLDGPQVRLLQKTGLADAVLAATTPDRAVWVARLGRLVEKRPSDQYGILYDRLVNTVRAQIPSAVAFVHGKVTALSTGADRQRVTIANGEEVSSRLVVLANGLNSGLRQTLGMERDEVSPCHSITFGFDMTPAGRLGFDFRALTYNGERIADRTAYLSLFPVGAAMRANLFVYRDLRDPWLQRMRAAPRETLLALLPNLQRLIGDFSVTEPVAMRPADLYVTRGYLQPGVVLVGDAFATSCPAAGTGVRKVLTDVERLCNVHVPRWLASDRMDAAKIAAFYDDPVKQACDRHSAAKAQQMRALTLEPGLAWRLRRWTRFAGRFAIGTLREARERFSAAGIVHPPDEAASKIRVSP
jgi:2-polyprenyl-6-methoxyphenol hydroxylase-like FAD-dependent oxidoreductase